METKARECIGYTVKRNSGSYFIISEMDYAPLGMDVIGAVEKIYFIEKCAYEKLQKRVVELETEVKRLHDKYDFQLLVKRNKKLREALGFYANWANWKDGKICETDITPVEFHGFPNFFQDIGGKKAREALGEVGE